MASDTAVFTVVLMDGRRFTVQTPGGADNATRARRILDGSVLERREGGFAIHPASQIRAVYVDEETGPGPSDGVAMGG